MALYDYSDRDSLLEYNQTLDKFGQVLTYLFTAEACLKIIGQGFCLKPNSYIRDGWNIIDFIVVITGYSFLSYLKILAC